jgi:hypothetical protein
MHDLAGFIAEQERLGRVVHVEDELDPVGAGVARRFAEREGRIVVLNRVRPLARAGGGRRRVSSRELMAAAIRC